MGNRSSSGPSRERSLSQGARVVLRQRYLARNGNGRIIETPDHMFRRIAADVARAERGYPAKTRLPRAAVRFYEMMASLDFLPNSPTLMNAGRPLQQLSACFVLPVEDSLADILESVRNQALIHQSGGGTGFSFSRLRPQDDFVASTSGVASGPLSFMRIFNLTTDVIKQGGMRRGANMGVLRADHPDILDFIALKTQPHEMTNFNLSVGLTDAFMEARRRNGRYALRNPRTGRSAGSISARMVFDRLVEAAWTSGEPGVLYLDTINRANPVAHLGAIEATNPCGEQPLLPYESCTLGSINVARYLVRRQGRTEIDYPRLAETIPLAVRFLDNVLDRNRYPLPEIEAATRRTRKIGLGIMGFADLLIALEIPYDTEEALRTASRLMAFVQAHAHDASRRLATERAPFPGYRGSRLAQRRDPRRHATVTTIAPTGTISIIAGCSPGIEPLYAVHTVRTVMDGTRLVTLHPAFRRMARAAGLDMDRLLPQLNESPSIRGHSVIPEPLRRLFVTAHDVDPAHHVRMQAIFQHYSDSGVSKTINLSAAATTAQVAEAFLLAYRLGCKGLTVFRTGSRGQQVLSCAVTQTCEDVEPTR